MSSKTEVQERLSQDKEYNISSYIDMKKYYNKFISTTISNRKLERDAFNIILAQKIPQNIEESLSYKDQRLLRLPLKYRSKKDEDDINKLQQKMKEEVKLCYNLDVNRNSDSLIYEFTIANVNRVFCVNIDTIIEDGSFNDELMLVNIYIDIPDSDETYYYPLNEDQSNEVITMIMMNYDINMKRKVKLYKEIYEIIAQISQLKYLIDNSY